MRVPFPHLSGLSLLNFAAQAAGGLQAQQDSDLYIRRLWDRLLHSSHAWSQIIARQTRGTPTLLLGELIAVEYC